MSSWTHSNIERAPVSDFEPATLVELLRRRALQQPERSAYTFLPDGETAEEHTSYGELDQKARALAAALQSANASGQRVLLLFPPGLDYIAAFFGCLYAGAVAVPSYPPRLNSLSQLYAIATDARASLALTTAAMYSRVEKRVDSLASLRWLTSDSIPLELAADWQEPVVSGSTLAFLQYTSGSTSTPKGVMVTHGNLLHNESIIQQVFRQTEESVIVGWLPFYHDMGLIGNVLQPLYLGARAILMSPMAFLQRPLRWLEAITQYKASTSGGPNFAYELCIRKSTPEQRSQLDLSTWRVAFNGAETVRAETLDRFAETFAPCGFRKEAFYPCYGLAEATLLVSGHKRTSLPVVSATSRVGCGHVAQTVVIVDPDSLNECTPGQVGEIWVNGPSVAMGYWNNPSETERSFSAHLSKTGAGPFMRTGDLGFLEDGELFVTGRLKDLIIIRGLNHYPQDIELTVETCHAELRPGCGAAFSVEVEGEEQLVLVQEVSNHSQSDSSDIIETIRSVVSATHEVQVYAVLLIRKGTIPKTTSGKIRRRACREQFLKGSLNTVAESRQTSAQQPDITDTPDLQSAASIREWLVQHLAARLGIKPTDVDLNQPLTRYGLDSLQAIELMHEIELSLKVSLPMASLLESPSIAALLDREISPIAEYVPASQRGAEHPLSYGQRALWFLQQMDPESAAYNLSFAARLGADLDVDRLGRAFQQLVNRHASLRTIFPTIAGQPVQRIQNEADVYFDIEDASDWSEDLLTERLAHEAHRPFDLERGPMLRVHVFKRPNREHVLLLVVHHIVSDFWSLAILMHELGALYATEYSLKRRALQYVDYSQCQAEMLAGAEGDKLWNYWRDELSGELPVVNLPSDRPRPPVQSHRGATRIFHVNAEVTQKLKDLSNAHGTTLYMTLLAAFYVLLYRYTGQEELVVGSPTTGRNQARWANVAGYFVNPLVLRAEILGSWAFENFLARVRVTVLLAFHHQDYPFALLVERLQPLRDPSRSPLFQIMFLLQKAQLLNDEGFAPFALGEVGARMKLGGLDLESIGLEQRTAIFDLMLMMTETEDGLAGSLQYNTDLFDEATVTRLASHFNNLLAAIVVDPTQTLATLPLLDEDERTQLVTGWNQTQAIYPHTSCIHELFEAQVERTPESVAVIDEHRRLSYRELNEKANQLAHYLRRRGVEPETRVGVMAERRIEMVIALLGVLKSGGAYVPLDAQYPRERLEYMLKDSGAEVLLTTGVDLETANIRTICLDEEELERESTQNLDSRLQSRNLAYVIYTSGSTGRPKGVAIEHQSTVTFLHWVKDIFSAEELSGVLASTSICFDLSVFELFAPLSWGGKVILADNVLQLPVLKAREEVSLINTVPSAMRELVRSDSVPASVRAVNLAGEPLKSSLVHAVYGNKNVERVFNLYGPSEDTTYSTCFLANRVAETNPAIGRPIANTRIYLLDDHLQLAPAGIPGELCVGGDGLARGYLNRPELTAERFIPDPFSVEPGARLYRTGDLSRYWPDGNIEYLGRNDHQVKIRGFRIELTEIEKALAEHHDVREAIVVAHENGLEDKRLVAYVEAASVTAGELRNHVRRTLPEHMVPAAFVLLEALPLTPNGKVNRKALPAPEWQRTDLENAFVAPRTDRERMIADIWKEVLGGGEQIGVNDNFFELGGHSLLAVQVVTRLKETFHVELPLRNIFEAPTIAGLAGRVETAGERKRTDVIERVSRNEELPLSFAQQRLWFLDQWEANNPFYNVALAVRLRGKLNVKALEDSFSEIIRRHEVLRTRFVEVDGRPRQVIADDLEFKVSITDVTEAEVLGRAAEEGRRAFDLSKGPLLRVVLLRLGAEDHVLLVTMHHIISDGWSIGVLSREVATLYEANHAGREATLPSLSIQYADFANWQRKHEELLEPHLCFWREYLAGAPRLLELPFARPRPAAQTFSGKRLPLSIGSGLYSDLKRLSKESGVTMFVTLLTAFFALLHRYIKQTDLVVGTPVAGRTRLQIEPLIGFFVNTLVLRVDVSGNPSFRELAQWVGQAVVAAQTHQDVPFEKLVEELRPERNLSHTPLFQVMFSLQNAPREELQLPELEPSVLQIPTGTSKFDLTFDLIDEGGQINGAVEYNTDLYDEANIDRLSRHFMNLLSIVASDPSLSLSALPLLDARERHQLLAEWNQTEVAYDRRTCVHQLFEEQAERAPEAVAAVDDTQRLSYGELNDRANRLAHYLRRHGVGPESTVGVMTERGVDLVVAVLGVLKAGAAYVPLDTQLPVERLQYMVADSGASVVVTGSERCEWLDGVRQVNVNVEEEETGNVESGVFGENLAYVIYTSGSTGKPKGVEISHDALLNLVHWHQRAFAVTQTDRATQLAGFGFDASVWELWPYLTAGASIHIPDDETRVSPLQLREWLVRNAITISFLPTPIAEHVVSLAWPNNTALRTLLTGGDKLHQYPAVSLPFTFVNNYGPTENTVVSTSCNVVHENYVTPPIGRPLDNTQIYLLDNQLQPVPLGVAGELCVSGHSLARGYLNQPALTAEKFIPHPFSSRAGARLYRTGDLARYLEDGQIEYLGRMDRQVKVRGFRIELGEIEAVLGQHTAVQAAVVTASESHLVAYVVPEAECAPTTPELQEFLKAKLPEHMMPRVFIMLEALPLTTSGKVDRQALPTPQLDHDRAFVAPRTQTEEMLAGIWAEVLNLHGVSIHDNFFELGGHSLLATQVTSRIRELFNIELPVRSLFEQPTVSLLAAAIDERLKNVTKFSAQPIERVSRREGLPLSFSQQRLWLFDQLHPGNSAYNVPAAIRLTGPLNLRALEMSFSEIIKRHEVLRTTFVNVNGELVQVIGRATPLNLRVTKLTAPSPSEREAEALRLSAEEARQPFDLHAGPLLRVSLLRLEEHEHVLLLTMHHMICDGWSMGIFVREIATLYEAFSNQQPPVLAELPIQYADFAMWQRQRLEGEVLETQLDYWRKRLGNAGKVVELVPDHPRPAVQTYRGAYERILLGAELSEALKALCRAENVTLFMALLAAFKTLLQRYTGFDEIVVGTDVANRNRVETEGLIGLFVNQLVLRTDLSGNPTFRELLGRVRETTLGAYAYQDLPFEKLVEELKPERQMNRNPLFQVMFILQNTELPPLRLSNLTLELLEVEEKTSAFDLTLSFRETEQGRISAVARYNTDLFEASTITRLLGHFEKLLGRVVSQPEARLNTFEFLPQMEKRKKREHGESQRKKFFTLKPKVVNLSYEKLIKMGHLDGQHLPFVIEPQMHEVDLVDWATQQRSFIEQQLLTHGAILFRGFDVEAITQFERFARAIWPALMEYGERSSPRTKLQEGVYTSTDHPEDQSILLHNEQSYTLNWPMKIWFYCVQPAQRGGNTPIADSRKILQRLRRKTVDSLSRKQVMYVRNYGDGLGLGWREVFQTDDRAVVEEHCRECDIEWEWKDDDRLRTRQVRPFIRKHPKTGEAVWFNHALFFHITSLGSALAGLSEDDLPFNTFYDDGSPFEASLLEEIREAYRQETFSFNWQHGDILMVDNMLVAHGREPFTGPRKIVVAMAEPFNEVA